MITEEYVSFEIAKLLKEKGFNEYCRAFRSPSSRGTKGLFYSVREVKNIEKKKTLGAAVVCPTLQMAMKWLREVHRIDIEVRTHYLNHLKPNDIRYYSGKILKGSEGVIHTIYSKDTYEEVCEEGIKYCLENLEVLSNN